MRKSLIYITFGSIGVAVTAAAILFSLAKREFRVEDILTLYRDNGEYGDLEICYPLDETLFPPEIIAPVFQWRDDNSKSTTWLVNIRFQDNQGPMSFFCKEPKWTPGPEQWETMKMRSLEKSAEAIVIGVSRRITTKIISADRITFRTSRDEVGAPVFYREVNLPFADAVKDPSRIRWRFGAISSPEQPAIILENLPVCGNCHSFPKDGKTLAMDVDYANNKGSYVIAEVMEEMVLQTSDIITWSDYKKEDDRQTFGLLSQISPDGRYVVSTVKDESVFVPKPDLTFSQLFFPIKGILCVYDRKTGTYNALRGADDPQYVQSNPTWSPDGQYIVFAKAKAYQLKNISGPRNVLLTPEQCEEFLKEGKPFQFDLYRVPFNEGKGGTPEPIEGASSNGMSNFFAKYSPDGKWIIFCKARNYMLLQPDSELYIIPAEGGQARRLRANTSRMNSWHSWSPNGKWLVFSSKANTAYTQLFLTHIDEQGHSSPGVLLERFTAPDRAANIPEFVATEATAISKIHEQFLDDVSFLRAADEFLKANDFAGAEGRCREALKLNPKNAAVHSALGVALARHGKIDEAVTHFTEAVRLNPSDIDAHYSLGQASARLGKPVEAIGHFSTVLQLKPDHSQAHGYLGSIMLAGGKLQEAAAHLSEAIRLDPNYADAYYNIGQLMYRQGKLDAAISYWSRVVQLKPDDAQAHYKLALALARRKQAGQAVSHYTKAVSLKPDVDTSALLHHLFAAHYAQDRRFHEAVLSEEKALELARAAGFQQLEKEIEKWLKAYKQLGNFSSKGR
ncbi:tetratricopeptide repeat protein [Planctomycetota bacterium]